MSKEYTILQIAKEALVRYKIRETTTMLDTVVKKIRKIINVQQFEASGMKKSTPQTRKLGKAYSEAIKNKIIQDFLFDYLIDRTYDDVTRRMKSPTYYDKQAEDSNGEFEDETLAILNRNPSVIKKHDLVIREKKQEIMLEALFSKFYSLNIDKLVEDVEKVEFAKNYKQGEFDKDDMRIFDRFNNWESYVDEK